MCKKEEDNEKPICKIIELIIKMRISATVGLLISVEEGSFTFISKEGRVKRQYIGLATVQSGFSRAFSKSLYSCLQLPLSYELHSRTTSLSTIGSAPYARTSALVTRTYLWKLGLFVFLPLIPHLMESPLIHYDDCYSPSECFGNANPFRKNLISSASEGQFRRKHIWGGCYPKMGSLFLYKIHSNLVSSLVCRFITSSYLDLVVILVFTHTQKRTLPRREIKYKRSLANIYSFGLINSAWRFLEINNKKLRRKKSRFQFRNVFNSGRRKLKILVVN